MARKEDKAQRICKFPKNLRVFSFLICVKTKNPPCPLVKGESHLCCHLELTIEGYFFYIKSQKNLNS
jgi:hypothetical protein